MNIPTELLYSTDHEWVRVEGNIAYIGITDYAQASLGDIVFVELPALGGTVRMGAAIGVIESVKAASDLFCPVSGTVADVNTALEDNPGLLNSDAYAHWIIAVNLKDKSELEGLLDAVAYQSILK